MLPFLAAATATPLEKLQNVSGQFWIKVIVIACILIGIIFLFKRVMGMNKIVLAIIGCVILGVVGFNWIYQRNEPEFLTPYVDVIAQWFPSKGAYETKQTQDPSRPGVQKTIVTPASKASPAAGTTAQPTKK
jgi:hypothetical protein